MNSFLISIYMVFLSFVASGQSQNEMTGQWRGIAVRQDSAQTFNFNLRIENDQLIGEYDIPDWGLYREPLKEINYQYPNFSARFMYGKFDFVINKELQEMTGGNPAWGPPITAHLKKSYRQPQVTVKDMSWQNKGIRITGELIEPAQQNADTLVVVIPGSGDQGLGTWRYRSYADFFAQNNHAAIVYNKRGIGDSEGDHHAVGFDVMAQDVTALLDLMRNKHPQFKKVGLLGISQGAWIASIVGNMKPRNLDFIIMSAGPAVAVWEQEMHAVKYQMQANKFSTEDIEEALAYTEQMFKVADTGKGWQKLKDNSDDIKAKQWVEFVSLVQEQQDLNGWLLQKYDPAEFLKNSRIPILSFFGDKDVLVPAQENEVLMRRYIESKDKPQNKVVVIKNVGHNMSYQRRLVNDIWQWPNGYWHWGRMAPEYGAEILSWLQRL